MSVLGIVAGIVLVLLVVWLGSGAWANEQEQARINAIIDRLEREPAYMETVSDRLERERRHGR